MPSQSRYIIEAALIIVFVFVAVKSLSFFSSAELYKDPNSILADPTAEPTTYPTNSQGRTLFLQKCASCHAINKQLVGPALAGIQSRVSDRNLLVAWIRNNREVLKSGNAYFNELYKEYNKTPMNLFPQLTDSEIESILNYITEDEIVN